MKAKELRIGNLVNVDEKAYKISVGDLYNLENYSKNYGHLYKPIPLTEEWLIRFGFEKKIINERTLKQTIYKSKYYYISLIDFRLSIDGKIYHKIDFVHQLQNLYFALTGEEL